jgi:hypothetical protein
MNYSIGRADPAHRTVGLRLLAAVVVSLTLTAAIVSPTAAQAVTGWSTALTRAPYLTDLVSSHVNVNWATNQSATTGSLRWGAVSLGTCTLTSSQTATRSTVTVGTVAEYQWKASLTLPGSGSYCYRPLLASTDLLGTGSSPQFQSQVPAGNSTPYSFDVFGDWGQVDGTGASADQANLFAKIAASGARFAVTVGDNGYPNGSQLNYGDLQQTGADTSAIFGPSFWTVAGSSTPLFTAGGNHGLSGPTHTDISTWTQDSAVSSSTGRYQNDTYCCVNGTASANYGSEWYAFDAGQVRFYVLDSAWGDSNVGTGSVYANDAAAHFTPGNPEYNWLLNDLQTHPSALKFAFFHYPLYSDNPDQNSDTSLQGLNGLEGLLGQYGVDIVFNGHAHLYERNNPSAAGMPVSYVTGGGGALLEPIGSCHSYDAYGIGWSPTSARGSACGAAAAPSSASQVFHFLKVSVSGMSVTVTPTDENGNTFDVKTYTFSNVPDTVVDSSPPPLTNSGTATLAFHATRAGASFGCSLDGAAATACTSPVSYPGLGSGQHSFAVTATTSAGTDPSPATAQWTVDTSPPSQPTGLAGSATSATAVSLSWTAATDNNGIASYDVQRNGVTIGSTGSPATSYLDTTAAPSTSYQYAVIARDAAGNSSTPSAPITVTTPVAPNGPTLVQSAGSSSTTVTLPGMSAPGDLLVLTAGVHTGASKPITAVTDGKNSWTKVGAYSVAGQNSDGELWYAANTTPVRTITVTTTANVALQVQEFNGVLATSPLDKSAGTAATANSANSGLATPTVTADLAIGFIAGHANTQAIAVNSPGYSLRPQQNTSGTGAVSVVSGFQTLSNTSPQSFSATFPNAMYWAAGIALFKSSTAPPPLDDFSIGATPSTLSITAGQNSTSTISTAVTSGNPQTLTLSGTGSPTATTLAFTPPTITTGQNSTLTITTVSNTPPGNYPLTITATGTTTSHSTTINLTVTAIPPDDFSIGATPATLSITAGQNTTSTISTAVTSGNPQTLTLSGTGSPTATTLAFTPPTITTGQNSTLTITTASNTAPGNYPLTITATGTTTSHSTTINLTVTTVSSGPGLVQAIGATETSTSTTLTATLPAASTAGNLLVLSASVYTGTTNKLTSVTDSAGNVWQKVNAWATASHNSDGELWYAANAAAATTVTVHVSLATSIAFEVLEVAGVAISNPLDTSAGASNTGTAASSGSITPASSGELLIGFVAGHANAQSMTANAAGFTVQPQQTTTGTAATVVTGYQVLASPSPISFVASFPAAMYWASGIAAFKAAG